MSLYIKVGKLMSRSLILKLLEAVPPQDLEGLKSICENRAHQTNKEGRSVKVPSPLQLREMCVQHLIAVAGALLEGGASRHLLFDKLDWFSFRFWHDLTKGTRRSYVVAALALTDLFVSQPSKAARDV